MSNRETRNVIEIEKIEKGTCAFVADRGKGRKSFKSQKSRANVKLLRARLVLLLYPMIFMSSSPDDLYESIKHLSKCLNRVHQYYKVFLISLKFTDSVDEL